MGEKDHFDIDLEDEVVRGSIVLDKGKMMWPPPAPSTPPVAPTQTAKEKAVVKAPEVSPFQEKMYEAGGTAGRWSQICSCGCPVFNLLNTSLELPNPAVW